jgi:hypothetical protein
VDAASEEREWARQHAPQRADAIDQAVARFVAYYGSRGTRRADWSLTWRDWWMEACERAARAVPRPAPTAPKVGGSVRAHVRGASGVADTGATYEDMRWLDSGTVAFQARRAELERDGLYDEVREMDAAGRIRMTVSAARRLEAGAKAASQPIGAILAKAASQRALVAPAQSGTSS